MSEENLEVVSQEMIDELASVESLDEILEYVYQRCGDSLPHVENYIDKNNYSNGTYLKIIQHLNGDLQFEAEKPKKYVIKYKELDYDDDPWFVAFNDAYSLKKVGYTVKVSSAAVFDTKEEAEKWTNPYTEVVEVEEHESN